MNTWKKLHLKISALRSCMKAHQRKENSTHNIITILLVDFIKQECKNLRDTYSKNVRIYETRTAGVEESTRHVQQEWKNLLDTYSKSLFHSSNNF